MSEQTTLNFRPRYYNTTGMTGQTLADYINAAQHQDDAIARIFADGRPRSPSEVWRLCVDAGKHWPLTSIRRAMSNLTPNLLEKTELQRAGIYGRPEHVWQLARRQA